MDYSYDIVLNFQDEYYEYYEWKLSDNIINLKKLPIYKVKNKDYLSIKNNITKIERNSLPKSSKIFLITSGVQIIGIFIDNSGRVIKKSSLLFEEADDILLDSDAIKNIDIKYQIIKKCEPSTDSRLNKEKRIYVDKYLSSLNKNKDEYLIKYLYYSIFNKEQDNIELIYNELLELSKINIEKIYNDIKNINIELKKTFP